MRRLFWIICFCAVVPLTSYGSGILKLVDMWWTPSDANTGNIADKYVTVTNTGDKCVNNASLRLSLASYGFYLQYSDVISDTLAFLCPGDTVTLLYKEAHRCNEKITWDTIPVYSLPIFSVHYQACPIELDSSYSYPFWVGHPDTTSPDSIKVLLTIDYPDSAKCWVGVSPNPVTVPPHDSALVSLTLVDSAYHDSTGVDGRPIYVEGTATSKKGDTIGLTQGAMVHQKYMLGDIDWGGWKYRAVENYYGLAAWGNRSIDNSTIVMRGNYNFITNGGTLSLNCVSLYADTLNPSAFYGLVVASTGGLDAKYLYIDDASTGPGSDNGALEIYSTNVNLRKSWIHNARHTGIKITKSTPNIAYCRIDSAECGILIDTCSPVLNNLIINDCNTDIRVRKGNPKFISCEFDPTKTDISLGDSISTLRTLYLKVFNGSLPEKDVNVVIKNVNGDTVCVCVTNTYGRIDRSLLEYLKYKDGGGLHDVYYAPYTISLKKNGFYEADTSVSFAGKDLYVAFDISSFAVEENTNIPDDYNLSLTSVNSTSSKYTFSYALPKTGNVKVCVYNVLGQKIATLENKDRKAGVYKVIWNGKNMSGKNCSSGAYFVRMNTGEISRSLQFVLVR
ncbi:MAG: FlgD immunoglobulin-like domain containing protein [bacterium]